MAAPWSPAHRLKDHCPFSSVHPQGKAVNPFCVRQTPGRQTPGLLGCLPLQTLLVGRSVPPTHPHPQAWPLLWSICLMARPHSAPPWGRSQISQELSLAWTPAWWVVPWWSIWCSLEELAAGATHPLWTMSMALKAASFKWPFLILPKPRTGCRICISWISVKVLYSFFLMEFMFYIAL